MLRKPVDKHRPDEPSRLVSSDFTPWVFGGMGMDLNSAMSFLSQAVCFLLVIFYAKEEA